MGAHHVLKVQREGSSTAKVAPQPTGIPSVPKGATDIIVEYQRSCALDAELLRCVIFPEGTTKSSQCLLKFRTGAFVSGAPVQPVAIVWPADMGWINSWRQHFLDL